MQKWHFKHELQKIIKHRSGCKWFMKLFVDREYNHILHLKRIKLVELGSRAAIEF